MVDAHLVRYYDAFQFGQNFLNDMQIDSFPLDVFGLEVRIKKYYGITVIITELADYNNYRMALGKKSVAIKDGRTIYDVAKNVFLIIYNEKRPFYRIRFTIIHEFAHIVLGHLDDEETEIERGGLSEVKYFGYEGEANTFAGNTLAPPILIDEGLGGCFHMAYVQALFQVSRDCAAYRKNDYEAWQRYTPKAAEKAIHLRCSKLTHIQFCCNCLAQFLVKEAKFCISCGHNRLTRVRSEKYMSYSRIEVDGDSKVLACPRCENQSINEGEYCKICGLHILNRCLDDYCYISADGDARYCHKCGEATSFGKSGILKNWQVEKSNAANASTIQSLDTLDDGECLPF